MGQSLEHGGGSDRVRRHSRESANAEIDFELEQRIRFYATQDRSAIDARLAELEREWDIERTLETNAASVSLAGLLLGITVNRRWFALPIPASARRAHRRRGRRNTPNRTAWRPSDRT